MTRTRTGRVGFDHELLVRRHPIEVERFLGLLQRGVAGAIAQQLHVEHEHDGSCCAREPWPATLAALLGSGVGRRAGGAP